MAEIETLVKDIQGLFGGAALSDALGKFSDDLGKKFLDKFARYAEERQPKLYMSNLGRPLRQLWYELKGYKGEPLSPETKLKFLYGDLIEDLVVFLAAEAGHKVERLQERIEVDGVSGKIDCFIDDVLIDIKSCSTRSFEKFANGTLEKDDPFGYIAQLSGYAKATGAKRAAFLAVGKELGKICIYEIKVEDYDVSRRIDKVRKAVNGDVVPERCYEPKPLNKTDRSGNLILGTGCSYCAFKAECWKDSNDGKGLQLRHYSTGPKWFVKIVKEPRLKEKFEAFPVKE